MAEIEDDKERTKKTLAYLRSLPPWPEPLGPVQPSIGQGTGNQRDTNDGPAGLSRLSLSRARAVLEHDYPDLRDRCSYVVGQLNDVLAAQLPAKPNDPEKLADWEHLLRTLELSRAAMIGLHEALPEGISDRPVTEEDAKRLRDRFQAAIELLQTASRYLDGAAEDHGRTYAGLLKLGVCAAVASPLALVSGTTFAITAGAIHVMLYGSEKVGDAAKLFGGSD